MTQNRPVKRIATVTLVVDDYDRALAFYCGKLGFACKADIDLGDGKRWVVVSPAEGGAGLLLAQADGEKQLATIGNQAGGRVAFFWKRMTLPAIMRRLSLMASSFRKSRVTSSTAQLPCSKISTAISGT